LHQPNTQQPLHKRQKATFGFVFSVVGAILILIRGLVRIIAGDLVTFAGLDVVRHRFLAGLALNIIGGIAVVFAVLIIIGANQIYFGMEMTGGIIVLIFSTLSIFVGSGWLIGLIVGVIGGILAKVKK
jgi:hypothetical protein